MKGRTFYINSLEKAHLLKLDGYSVVYTKSKGKHHCSVSVPLRQITRVVIFGNFAIPVELFSMFSELQIPILFIGSDSEKISTSICLPFESSFLNSSLKGILANSVKKEDFIKWLKSQRKQARQSIARELSRFINRHNENIQEDNYEKILSLVIPSSSHRWENVRTLIQSLFFLYCIDVCIRFFSVNPHEGIFNSFRNFGCVRDMLYLIDPEIDYQSVLFFKECSIKYLDKRNLQEEPIDTVTILNVITRFEERLYHTSSVMRNMKEKIDKLLRA